MAEAFRAGDVVRLKSGGPNMTVEKTGKRMGGDETVWCVWFDNTQKFDDTFPPDVLERVPNPKISVGGPLA